MPANKCPCPHPIPWICEKDPPGPMAEPTAQKLGRLGVAHTEGRGLSKRHAAWFFPPHPGQHGEGGDSVVGLGCKGGLGDPISMVNNPTDSVDIRPNSDGSYRVGSPQHREKGGGGGLTC